MGFVLTGGRLTVRRSVISVLERIVNVENFADGLQEFEQELETVVGDKV